MSGVLALKLRRKRTHNNYSAARKLKARIHREYTRLQMCFRYICLIFVLDCCHKTSQSAKIFNNYRRRIGHVSIDRYMFFVRHLVLSRFCWNLKSRWKESSEN